MKANSLIGLLALCTFSFPFSGHSQNCCRLELSNDSTIEKLGKEFQRLKKDKDRTCCDYFGNGLMNVMELLNDSLKMGITEQNIVDIMGTPDSRASKEFPIEHHFTQLPEDQKVLIYMWRGMHDFLYFVFQGDKLIIKKWYYAWE